MSRSRRFWSLQSALIFSWASSRLINAFFRKGLGKAAFNETNLFVHPNVSASLACECFLGSFLRSLCSSASSSSDSLFSGRMWADLRKYGGKGILPSLGGRSKGETGLVVRDSGEAIVGGGRCINSRLPSVLRGVTAALGLLTRGSGA